MGLRVMKAVSSFLGDRLWNPVCKQAQYAARLRIEGKQ